MYNLPVYPLRFSSCMSCLGVNAERGFSESGGGNFTCRIDYFHTLFAIGENLPVASLVEVLNRERPAAPGAGLGLRVFHYYLLSLCFLKISSPLLLPLPQM